MWTESADLVLLSLLLMMMIEREMVSVRSTFREGLQVSQRQTQKRAGG